MGDVNITLEDSRFVQIGIDLILDDLNWRVAISLVVISLGRRRFTYVEVLFHIVKIWILSSAIFDFFRRRVQFDYTSR